MTGKKLIAILLVFACLLGVVLWGWYRYSQVDFYGFYENSGIYSSNGKFLISSDGNTALLYRPLLRDYESAEKITVDLTPYGFEGESFSGFVFDGIFYGDGAEYEGFWPVSTPEKFIYIREGEKFIIDTQRVKAYPMFSGSVAGVDETARGVKAFSADGVFAAAIEGNEAVIYVSDSDAQSFKIESVRRISLSEWGDEAEFGAFLGTHTAYATVSGEKGRRIVALDCSKGVAALSALPETGEYGAVFSRVYTERKNSPSEAEDAKNITVGWNNMILGDSFSASLPREEISSAKLCGVSPEGDYGVIEAIGRDGKSEYYIAHNNKIHSLSAYLGEDEPTDVFFCYNNILYLNLKNAAGEEFSRSYKICF